MAARKLGARQIVSLFPAGFTVTKAGNGAYTLGAVGDSLGDFSGNTASQQPKASSADAPAAPVEPTTPPTPEQRTESAETPPAAALTIADVDLPLLMQQAHEAGLVADAAVNPRTLYRLLSGTGVGQARSRMSRAELNGLLVEHLDAVAAAIVAPTEEARS